MHPSLLHHLATERERERRAGLAGGRAAAEREPRPAASGWRQAGARLGAGVGWLLVDLKLRLAVKRGGSGKPPAYLRQRA